MDFDFTKQPGHELMNRGLGRNVEALVSIITPYYNAGKHFEQTFNCVMNQSFPWFECIIVDDGSTDEESLSILSFFSEKDKRIRILRKKWWNRNCKKFGDSEKQNRNNCTARCR